MEKQHQKIQIGYQVGALTVTGETDQRKNRYRVWECTCSCGNKILLDTHTMRRQTVSDCGCRKKISPRTKDLTGKRFGRLVCKYPTKERGTGGGTVWFCECDCGNTCLAVSTQLTKGYKKSCGCLSHPPRKDYVGKRFGRLTVIGYAGKWDGMHRWRCRCDCGKETVVGQTPLQTGKTRSCGCLQAATILENLKLCEGTSVTILEARRRHPSISNTSGYTGVYQSTRTGKWSAQITFKGKTYYLGSFADIQDAVAARKEGEHMHENFLEWYHTEEERKESDRKHACGENR